MKIWEVTYKIGETERTRTVLAPFQVLAWLKIYRSHFSPVELVDVKYMGRA